MAQHKANFYLLNDDASSLATNFGDSLDAFPYVTPDVQALKWHHLFNNLHLWTAILR